MVSNVVINEFFIEMNNGGLPDSSYLLSNSMFIHTSQFQKIKEIQKIKGEFFYASYKDFYIKIEHREDPKLEGIIAVGKVKKEQLKLITGDPIKLYFVGNTLQISYAVEVSFTIIFSAKEYVPEIDEDTLEKKLKNDYNNSLINKGDRIYLDIMSKDNKKQILILEVAKLTNSEDKEEQHSFFMQDSTVNIEYTGKDLKITGTNRRKKLVKGGGFNFVDMGVGGMHDEINRLLRTTFNSRIHSNETLKKFGIKHVKGVLLYGPPGTGKTLLAKTLSKMLDAEELTIVNGPELFDKYVGETEKKIRELFLKAEQDEKLNGENSGLHIIVFDEIDSICRSRGSISSGTGVHDSAVNQLLTKIDGVNSLNNILIIGMTNRKELIDEAILRPGRLSVHIEIGLPTLKERIEIFKIHTKTMKESNTLEDDVNIEQLAEIAENFTGAEIATLVERASSYALASMDLSDFNKKGKKLEYSKVSKTHFNLAFNEVKPMFGTDKVFLESSIKFGIIEYGKRFNGIFNQLNSYVRQLKTSKSANLMSILLHGDAGNGKTSLACHIAMNSGFPYVKLISPSQLAKLNESGKAQEIMNIFENAYKSPLSFIVIDNIERVIEYIKIGPRFSNLILQSLLVYINKAPIKKDHKLIIIGTTNIADRLDDLELVNVFNHKLKLPNLAYDEVSNVLKTYNDIDSDVSDKITKMFKDKNKFISIKNLLMSLDETIQQKGNNFTFEDYKEIMDLKEYENDLF